MKLAMKFGGTSVADGEHIKYVAKLVANYIKRGNNVVVVISAFDGVTDQLIEVSNKMKNGDEALLKKFIKGLSERHLKAIKKAIKNESVQKNVAHIINATFAELERVLTGIRHLGELTPKSMDYVLSFGERLSTPIVWGALSDLGLNAKYYTGKEVGIVTDSSFGEARPLINLTKHQVKERLEPVLRRGITPVVTGYIAATQEGITTTLGRGGSDYTATLLGAALDVDEIWIWTDVDGLMTSDPRIVASAKVIPELSFQEATEMAIFGAKIMHPRALEPAVEEGIPVRIRNTFKPNRTGTLIIKEQKIKPQDIVKAIPLVRDVAMVTVSGAGMAGTPGTAAKVFDVLGKNNINILMISQSVSESNISFIIPSRFLDKAVSALEIALLGRGIVREVTAEDDVCVVAAVGAGMKGTPGVAARVFGAVARKGVNVRMIAQGSSELNISFIVKESDGGKTVQAIHDEFGLGKPR